MSFNSAPQPESTEPVADHIKEVSDVEQGERLTEAETSSFGFQLEKGPNRVSSETLPVKLEPEDELPTRIADPDNL